MKNDAFVGLVSLLLVSAILLAVLDWYELPVGKVTEALQEAEPLLPQLDLAEGWNFIAFSEDLPTSNFQDISIYELRDNAWQPFTGTQLEKNKGYFLNAQVQTIPLSEKPLVGSLVLVPGWNAFGVPANVPVSNLKVAVQNNVYTLAEAVAKGLIKKNYIISLTKDMKRSP